jgi:hypothetical protein
LMGSGLASQVFPYVGATLDLVASGNS